MTWERIGVTLLAATAARAFASAQARQRKTSSPSKPVKILVPYAPAAPPTSLPASSLEPMRVNRSGNRSWSRNKPGAFGILAIEEMARARADGYRSRSAMCPPTRSRRSSSRSKFKVNYDRDVAPVTNLDRRAGVPGGDDDELRREGRQGAGRLRQRRIRASCVTAPSAPAATLTLTWPIFPSGRAIST